MADRTCTIEGCGKKLVARGLCKTHYNLWHRANAPGAGRTCQAGECERRHYALGWCTLHYERWKKTGGARRPISRAGRATPCPLRPCGVSGCDKPARSRGWCPKHYTRWSRHGDLNRVDRGGYAHPKGPENPKWAGEPNSYRLAHDRVRQAKGRPTCCIMCGAVRGPGLAIQWALDWDRVSDIRYCPMSRRGKVEMLAYSVSVDDYIALCLKCHRRFDLEHKAKREAVA